MKKRIRNIYNAFLLLLLLLCSCGTQRNNSDSLHAKVLYTERILRDSVFLHDSVFVKEQADTVFLTRYRTLYRDRVRIDTLWQCDTVHIVKEIVKERKGNTIFSIKNLLLVALAVFLLWKSGIISMIKKE